MPPLIRRSQSAVPSHADEDGGHSGLGSHPTAPAATLARNSGRPGPGQRGCCPSGSANRVRELDALRGDLDEVRARLSEHIPLRRYGEPEEFGWAAAFVLSPAASRITGAMIPVDGGAISSI